MPKNKKKRKSLKEQPVRFKVVGAEELKAFTDKLYENHISNPQRPVKPNPLFKEGGYSSEKFIDPRPTLKEVGELLGKRIKKLNEPLVFIENTNEVFKLSKKHPTTGNNLSIKLSINHKLGTYRITTIDDIEDFRFRNHEITLVVTELITTATTFATNRINEIKGK